METPSNYVFFDIYVENEYLLYDDFCNIVPIELRVPYLATVNGIHEVLYFNSEIDSTILGIENNTMEGIVGRPIKNSNIKIKKVNPEFTEKQSGKRGKELKVLPPNIISYRESFSEYLNDNRLQHIFSHEGPIENMKQMGKYIKLMMADAIKDFESDLADEELDAWNGLDKVDKKTVFAIGGKLIAQLIKEYMSTNKE